jgi:eukaryotic-like serine/threonine-protein kinase
MSSDSQDVKQIFAEAIERFSPDEWDAYLDRACGNDAKLRRRVQFLVKAHVAEGGLLDTPATAAASTAVLAAVTEHPGDIIDHYRLLEEMGEGGMGVVYKAQQQEPVHRQVALKILKPGMDTRQVIARFEAERQALALMDYNPTQSRISHPMLLPRPSLLEKVRLR